MEGTGTIEKIIFGIINSAIKGNDRLLNAISDVIAANPKLFAWILEFSFIFLFIKFHQLRNTVPPQPERTFALSFPDSPPPEAPPLIPGWFKMALAAFILLVIIGIF